VRGPGDIVLVSCYEPGHQPQGVASAVAFLRRAGFQPTCLDLAVEPLDDAARARLAAARLVAISVPMHTALVLGRRVAAHVRRANPGAHICVFGMYATLNAALLASEADSVLGPDCETQLGAPGIVTRIPAPRSCRIRSWSGLNSSSAGTAVRMCRKLSTSTVTP